MRTFPVSNTTTYGTGVAEGVNVGLLRMPATYESRHSGICLGMCASWIRQIIADKASPPTTVNMFAAAIMHVHDWRFGRGGFTALLANFGWTQCSRVEPSRSADAIRTGLALMRLQQGEAVFIGLCKTGGGLGHMMAAYRTHADKWWFLDPNLSIVECDDNYEFKVHVTKVIEDGYSDLPQLDLCFIDVDRA